MQKNLIIYYSRRGQNYVNGAIRNLAIGNAELIASFVQRAVGGDLFKIETVKAYSEEYTTCTEEAKKELRRNARPKLTYYLYDISAYDNVFILGPCWWGTYPMAMYSLLENLDFTGKKVFLMMTHEGSGMGKSQREMKKICKGATFGKSLAVRGANAPSADNEVFAWAKSCVS